MKRNVFMFILMLMFIFQTHASAEDVNNWGGKELVSPNKVWSIKVNKEVNTKTLTEQNIYVKDQQNQTKEVQLAYDAANKKILVSPVTPYEYGETYTLWITKNLESKSGKALLQTTKKTFTIKNLEPSTVEFQQNVIVIGNEDQQNIVAVSNDLETIQVSKDSELLVNLTKGQIILLPPSEQFPYQMARKVQKIEQSANGVVLHTETPAFEEVYKTLKITYETPITVDDLQPPDIETKSSIASLTSANLSQSKLLAANDWSFSKPIYKQVGNSLTVGFDNITYTPKLAKNDEVKINVSSLFKLDNPKFITEIEYVDGELKQAELAIKIDNISSNLDVDIEASLLHNLRKEYDLIKPVFIPARIYGVPLPVGGLATLKGVLDISASADASISTSYEKQVYVGIFKDRKDTKMRTERFFGNDSSLDISLKESSGKATASASIKPGVSIAYMTINLKREKIIDYERVVGVDAPVGVKGEISGNIACFNIDLYAFAETKFFYNQMFSGKLVFSPYSWRSKSIFDYADNCLATKQDLAKTRFKTEMKAANGDLYTVYVIPTKEKTLHDKNDSIDMMMYPKGLYEGNYRIALEKAGSKKAIWQDEKLSNTQFYELYWETEMAYTIKGKSKGVPDILGISTHETYNDVVARLYAIHNGKLVKLHFAGDEGEEYSILTADKPRYINANTIQNVIFTRGATNSTWKYVNYSVNVEKGLLKNLGTVKTYNLDNGGWDISERWYANPNFYVKK